MQITIKLFAGIADRLGSSTIQYTFNGQDLNVASLKEQLTLDYPEAASILTSSFIAVNQQYAAGDDLINENDEVAIIPPVSGGEEQLEPIYVETEDGLHVITTSLLDVAFINAKVNHPNHGASICFIGTTREWTGDHRTILLEYEAYIPMALSTLQQIGNEVNNKWVGSLCAISHRIGKVDISEASVVIAVSSPHRDSCYEASRYAIERLKQIVPIWKKEVTEDSSEWMGDSHGTWSPF